MRKWRFNQVKSHGFVFTLKFHIPRHQYAQIFPFSDFDQMKAGILSLKGNGALFYNQRKTASGSVRPLTAAEMRLLFLLHCPVLLPHSDTITATNTRKHTDKDDSSGTGRTLTQIYCSNKANCVLSSTLRARSCLKRETIAAGVRGRGKPHKSQRMHCNALR